MTRHATLSGSDRYLNEFMALTCAPRLLAAHLFPQRSAVKEISESMSAWAAVRRVLGPARAGDPTVRVYDVGAGHKPRTAALFALTTRWEALAIDPLLRPKGKWNDIARLSGLPAKIEEVDLPAHDGLAVICLVHAHVTVPEALAAIKAPEYLVIGLPCCVPHELEGKNPVEEYEDEHCWSGRRTVKIWQF